MGSRNASAFCFRHGVQPINVSASSRVRLRWRRSDIIKMLDDIQLENSLPDEFQTDCAVKHSVIGKTVDELFRELRDEKEFV